MEGVGVYPGICSTTFPSQPGSPVGAADSAEVGLSDPVMRTGRGGWPKATVLRTFRWEVALETANHHRSST